MSPYTVLNFTYSFWDVKLTINPFRKTKEISYSTINSLNPFLCLAVIVFHTYSSWKDFPIHEICNEARINENPIPIPCHWNLWQYTDLYFKSWEEFTEKCNCSR